MKSTKSLLAALVLVASVTVGCKKEITATGIDPSKPAPKEFTYDEIMSSSTAIAVYWDGSEAVANGATGFTVQIPTELNNGDVYDSQVSQTLLTSASVYEAATFSNLAEYERHYVRVRANYPNSVYSEWVYLTLNGEPAPFEVGYGFIDVNMPAVDDIAYNNEESTVSSMTFDFDAAAAESKDAVALRFQLINTTTDAVSATVEMDFPLSVQKAAFSGLKEGDQYKVRVRAEYEGEQGLTTCSEWLYAEGVTADGEETDIFEVGKGPAVPVAVPPVARLAGATSSTLIFEWSESEFTSLATDVKRPYNVQLYKDEACSDLVVSWLLDANSSLYGSYQPSFLFSGLDQNTAYYFMVTDTESGLSSEPVQGKTEAFTVVTVGDTKVAAGGYVLAEDFSELVWGGDYIYKGVAYSSNGRSSATTLDKASGENPVGGGSGYYLVNCSTEMGLFNTLSKAVPSTRLSKWGVINEGTANSYMCARPGHLKLGASSYVCKIVTPELANLSETATVEVSFLASPYYNSDKTVPDNLDVCIMLITSSTLGTQNVLEVGAGGIVQEFELVDRKEWQEFKFNVSNVTPTSRIAIGPNRKTGTAGSTQQRMYLDNIQIKVVSYGSTAVSLDAPVLGELASTDNSIVVKWDAVNNAMSYVVEYKESSASEWTVAGECSETEYTITPLEQETSYDVRVKAKAAESESEYSEVKTIATIRAAAIELGKVFYSDATVTWPEDAEATGFAAYLNGSKVADIPAGTYTYKYTGLSKATTYSAQIGILKNGSETKTPEVQFTTGDIFQMTNNVGPTHITVGWDDLAGGNGNTAKAYYVELSSDASGNNKVYSLYCYDGQASANGAYGSSSWVGKTNNSNNNPATRIAFGQLSPGTTYYFRVKTVANATMSYNYYNTSTITLNAPAGESEFSEWVPFTTESSHSLGAKEILFEGFDAMGMQADFVNMSAGVTPRINAKGTNDNLRAMTFTYPWKGEWCVYPFANSHLCEAWGFADAGSFIDGNAEYNTFPNYIFNDNAGTLKGWYVANEVTPHHGSVKIGNSSKGGYFLGTPALNSDLLGSDTPCTFKFKACKLNTGPVSAGKEITIVVYRKATGTFETVDTITLTETAKEGAAATDKDYTNDYKWETISVDLNLSNGDNVNIVSGNKTRVMVDDISLSVK